MRLREVHVPEHARGDIPEHSLAHDPHGKINRFLQKRIAPMQREGYSRNTPEGSLARSGDRARIKRGHARILADVYAREAHVELTRTGPLGLFQAKSGIVPEGKLHAIGRGPVDRKYPIIARRMAFLDTERATQRKCVRDAALFRLRGKHENLPTGSKSTRQSVHIRAIHPIVVRDEDTRFSRALHTA